MGSWQFTSYALLYFLAVGLSILLAYQAWRMRPVHGVTYFSLMTLSSGIWALGYLLGFFNTDLGWKLAMLRVEYLGAICANTFWLLFVATYTQSSRWLTRRMLALLSIVPLITFIQVLVAEQHDFFYRSYDLVVENGLVVSSKVYGPGFYLWIGYAYLVMIAGVAILVRGILQMPDRFRGQIIPHIIVVVVILSANFLYVSGNNPISPYDPTSLSFVIAGVLFMFTMRRYSFLSIVPVAYNLVFKSVNSGVIIISERDHVLEMNQAAERILGRTKDEVLGKSVLDIWPEYRSLTPRFRGVLEFKSEVEMGQGAQRACCELQVTPLTNTFGRPIGRIIMLYDITERKRALDELDAYAHTVAHNLKNPLGALVGHTELLRVGKLSEKEEQRSLQAVSNSALKMNDIVDDLLLLASVRSQEKAEMSPLDMGVVVSNALSQMSRALAENDAQIIQPEVWPNALGYAPWVEEVWVNYISNALKYGGSPPIIILGADSQGAMVRFWVKDNGRGLSKKEQVDLFTEFTRLERHKAQTRGHGLGLSIVRRIVERLDGQVGVESEPGEGSLFYFTLPRQG